MKYRDPNTEEVFEDIEAARVAYCESFIKKGCNGCLISIHSNGTDDMYCGDFPEAYPIEAARLMGLEVVEDKKEPMEKMDKPRICEVLGVEIGERFRVVDHEADYDSVEIMINEFGDVVSTESTAKLLPALLAIHAINHPDRILRKPRFAPGELAILREWGKSYPGARLVRENSGRLSLRTQTQSGELADWLFQGIRPGQSIELSTII